jgi:sulfatase modifying factor 1
MRRLPIVLAAALGLGAGNGKVVRVEVEHATVVEVPGGTFTMGLSPPEASDGATICTTLLGENRSMTPIAALVIGQSQNSMGFCEEYGTMLAFMLRRDVTVSAFALDRDEVTSHDYRACVADGACGVDPLIDGDERYNADDLPLVNVTWDEAQTFCRWRKGRLPTEAEWERAARGDDARAWPWGDDSHLDDWNHGKIPADATIALDDLPRRNSALFGMGNRLNFTPYGDPDDSDGFRYAAPPGSFVWDEGPYGTRDQAGNVAEWVVDEDSMDGYNDLPAVDPVRNPDATADDIPRVVRGGSWRDPPWFGQTFARTDVNRLMPGGERYPTVGFRCAYDR